MFSFDMAFDFSQPKTPRTPRTPISPRTPKTPRFPELPTIEESRTSFRQATLQLILPHICTRKLMMIFQFRSSLQKRRNGDRVIDRIARVARNRLEIDSADDVRHTPHTSPVHRIFCVIMAVSTRGVFYVIIGSLLVFTNRF